MMNIYSFPYLIFEQIEIILANRIQYDRCFNNRRRRSDSQPAGRWLNWKATKLLRLQIAHPSLDLLKTHHFEVVLCDVFLPDGNGVDFIFDIHRMQPDAAVILLTAHGNIADGVQAIKNGYLITLPREMITAKLFLPSAVP